MSQDIEPPESGPPAAEPWDADRMLDTARAAKAIREALPALRGASVHLLGRGWDFDAYEVAVDGDAEGEREHYVFRFPRRAGEQARLRKDLAILPWLGAQLDAPLPVYAWGALQATCFPYIFSGYPKLYGERAADLDPATVDLTLLGEALGGFFRTLHGLTVPAAIAAALHDAEPCERSAAAVRVRMEKYIQAFVAEDPKGLGARAAAFFEREDLVPRAGDEARCLTHDDLHGEHLLLDPEDPSQISGLLDWSDVTIGHPAGDLACIYPWGGEELLRPLLKAYGREDPSFAAQVRYRGLCISFMDWHHSARVGQHERARLTLRILAERLPPS